MKVPKQPNEAVKRTPMEPQKLKDTLLLLNNYSADGKADGIYKNCGYQGYEQYEPMVMDGLPFLLWKPENDKQIENPNFKWQDFQAKPYISYESDSNGYTFIQAPAVVKRDSERFRTNRQQRYHEFIKSFSPETGSPLKLLAGIHGLHSMLEQQAARQIEQLESADQELIRLLKVYRFETQQNILNTGSPETQTEQLQNFIIDTRHLYQWGIRHVANTETLLQHWIPKRIQQPFVPAPIGQSLMNGIKALMPKKERILNSMIPIIEKLIHIETLKYYALNDMPVLDDDQGLPELTAPNEIQQFDKFYWDTAQTYKNEANVTWESTYDYMERKRSELGLDVKYSTFDSFNTRRKAMKIS